MENLKLDFDTEINLYRLIQEGLNNIKKHADASQSTIRLLATFPYIILRIEDDGQGFDIKERLSAAQQKKRMGLRSMEERVDLLGGKMKIYSQLSKGTKIFIEVPYKPSPFHAFGSSNENCSLAEPISMMERSSMMVGSFTVLPLSLGLARPVIWAI